MQRNLQTNPTKLFSKSSICILYGRSRSQQRCTICNGISLLSKTRHDKSQSSMSLALFLHRAKVKLANWIFTLQRELFIWVTFFLKSLFFFLTIKHNSKIDTQRRWNKCKIVIYGRACRCEAFSLINNGQGNREIEMIGSRWAIN